MKLLDKMKRVIVYPDEFFQEEASPTRGDESGTRTAFLYYFLISIASLGISWLLFSTGITPGSFFGMGNIFFKGNFSEIIVPIIFMILGLVSLGILSIVTGMIAKKPTSNVLKAGAYGLTPAVLLSWLPVLNLLAGLWGWILFVKGGSILNKMGWKSFLYSSIPGMILILGLNMLTNYFVMQAFA